MCMAMLRLMPSQVKLIIYVISLTISFIGWKRPRDSVPGDEERESEQQRHRTEATEEEYEDRGDMRRMAKDNGI